MTTDHLRRHVPALKREVFRVGLAGSFGVEEDAVLEALRDGPVQYVFWNPTARNITGALRRLSPSEREKLVIATGPSLGFWGGTVRSRVEKVLRELKTEYVDVLQVFWVNRTSVLSEGVLAEMVRLREEGKARAIGVSIHDRVRAGKLAEDSPLDLLMIRYNAAHPGAERDIFPHLARRQPAVVAYTATAWRQLMRRPRGWDGPVMTAADCYRFCLASPHVDVVLMGPSSGEELRANLRDLARGPPSEEQLAWMRRFGHAVHG